MLIANYFTIDGQQVGDSINCNTDDLEFATLQAIAVTGLEVIKQGNYFTVLGDEVKRLVIGFDS